VVAPGSALATPTSLPLPIQQATFTVGTLAMRSGVSPAGEYQMEIPLDVPRVARG